MSRLLQRAGLGGGGGGGFDLTLGDAYSKPIIRITIILLFTLRLIAKTENITIVSFPTPSVIFGERTVNYRNGGVHSLDRVTDNI